jgi:hypothetical protein
MKGSMKPSAWHQEVLLVSLNIEVRRKIATAFGTETSLVFADTSVAATSLLAKSAFQVVILDTGTIDPSLTDENGPTVNGPSIFFQLLQQATQLNRGVTTVALTHGAWSKDPEFAQKCARLSLVMDQKNISIPLLIHVIRILRKRTFRTVLSRDLHVGHTVPVDIHHYLALNDRFALFLSAGEMFSQAKSDKLAALHVRHLFVQEDDLPKLFSFLRQQASTASLYSEELASARNLYRQVLTQFFNSATHDLPHVGSKILDDGMKVVALLEKLIDRYPNYPACLDELPYRRPSALAHGLNCAIYSLIFSKACQLNRHHEIAFAALIHNIG